MRRRTVLRTLIAPIVLVLATIYFVLDALVLSILRPPLRYLARLGIFYTARRWIESLSPYATLAIFLIPVTILEPVKPLSAYLIATSHFVTGVVLLICAELLKIAIVERIFHIGRPKLMTIGAFAWTYNFIVGWLMWLQALPPWQEIKRRYSDFRRWVRQFKQTFRMSEHI